MKTNVLLLLTLILSSTFTLQAQPINLVNNGSFETVVGYPTAQGELFRALGWSNCNGGTTWPYGSPDLFHTNATGNLKLPNTVAGTVSAFDGNAVAGFITSNGVVPNFREYLSYQFESPMVVGQVYELGISLTNGSANWYGNRGSNRIGFAFTNTQPTQTGHDVINLIPQIEINSIVRHTTWVSYSFSFTADQPYTYLTIGNFRDDANTNFATYSGFNDIAYYFIDMITVNPVTPLAAEMVRLQQLDNAAAMELNWHVPAEAAGDHFVLERSSDQQSFTEVSDFGIVENAGADAYFTDATALAGYTYYYRLRDLSINGELRFSAILEASFGKAERFVSGEVYPNPVQDHFSLAFESLEEGALTVQIYNAAGQMVHQGSQDIYAGQSDPMFTLPDGLAAGIYQAKFGFGGASFSKKLLVKGRI